MQEFSNTSSNAQKWSPEIILKHLVEIEKEAIEGESLFLGRALIKQGLYKHVWTYWKKIMRTDEDIIDRMMRIESIYECKLLEGALKKQLSATMATLTLRYNYQWNDRSMRPRPENMI